MSELVRLQKYLAQCGVASRRKAEALIAAGRISVDGETVSGMGKKIDPRKSEILLDGDVVKPRQKTTSLLLNKPKGYVTTTSDPQGRPIVTDLVDRRHERLFPVGRLDLDTQGALILTNDGELAQRIQHPSHQVTKTYEAIVSAHPTAAKLRLLEVGIEIEGKKTAPASLQVKKKFQHSTLVAITIHEGRKRQVKKMFAAIGHPVINLKRVAYGNLRLGNLQEGSYRRLTPKDFKRIFQNIPLQKEK